MRTFFYFSCEMSSWTAAEDAKLSAVVQTLQCADCPRFYHSDCPCGIFKKQGTWKRVAEEMGGGRRTYGACQGRWATALDPMVDDSEWTPELDSRLLKIFPTREFDTWVKRARELSLPGKRRNGADVASRYALLLKRKSLKRPAATITEEDADSAAAKPRSKRKRS